MIHISNKQDMNDFMCWNVEGLIGVFRHNIVSFTAIRMLILNTIDNASKLELFFLNLNMKYLK